MPRLQRRSHGHMISLSSWIMCNCKHMSCHSLCRVRTVGYESVDEQLVTVTWCYMKRRVSVLVLAVDLCTYKRGKRGWGETGEEDEPEMERIRHSPFWMMACDLEYRPWMAAMWRGVLPSLLWTREKKRFFCSPRLHLFDQKYRKPVILWNI